MNNLTKYLGCSLLSVVFLHKWQYQFIEEVKDYIKAASELFSRMKPANEWEEVTVKAAMKELSQGAKVLVTQQKLIRIVDCSDLG